MSDDDIQIRPGVTFFFTGCADSPKDTIDVTSEGISPVLSFDEAVEVASDLTQNHGGVNFVIECKVVACVSKHIRIKKYGARR